MKIAIKSTDSSDPLYFDYLPTYTVEKIKQLIEEKKGIFPQKQLLIFNGSPLLDDKQTLKNLLISPNDDLYLFTQNKIALFVKPIDSLPFLMKFDPTETLADLQKAIEEAIDSKIENQLLVHNSNQIDTKDSHLQKLDTMKFTDGDTIKVVDKTCFSTIRLFIKLPFKPKKAIDVDPSMSVTKFIDKYAQNMPVSYKDKLLLKCNMTLDQVGLRDEDVIWAVYSNLEISTSIIITLDKIEYKFEAELDKTLKWLSEQLQVTSKVAPNYSFFDAQGERVYAFRFFNGEEQYDSTQYDLSFAKLEFPQLIALTATVS